MNEALAVRQEIHGLIDSIPEHNLYALKPLLNVLTDAADDDVLSDEELDLLAECRKNRKEHPETFTEWADVKKELGI